MGKLRENLDSVFSNVDDVLKNAKNSNLEDVVARTKNYAEKAGKISVDRLDISKKKVELIDAKTKLSKAYERFGKLEFINKTGIDGKSVDSEELQSATDEILMLISRIDYLNKEIDDLKADFNHRYGDILKKSSSNKDENITDDVVEFSSEDITIE